jgi:hypothetical protein
MNPLNKSLSPHLFWDTNAASVDPEREAAFIVKRVLEYGLWDDWLLIADYYGLPKIVTIAAGLRDLNPKSLAFISQVAEKPIQEFRCYATRRSTPAHWNF